MCHMHVHLRWKICNDRIKKAFPRLYHWHVRNVIVLCAVLGRPCCPYHRVWKHVLMMLGLSPIQRILSPQLQRADPRLRWCQSRLMKGSHGSLLNSVFWRHASFGKGLVVSTGTLAFFGITPFPITVVSGGGNSGGSLHPDWDIQVRIAPMSSENFCCYGRILDDICLSRWVILHWSSQDHSCHC